MEEELPHRTVREIEYELNPDKNTYEHTTYESIVNWISEQEISPEIFEKRYISLITAFFSSSWAFNKEIGRQKEKGMIIDPDVEENAKEWLNAEEWMLKELDNVLAEPYNYSSRILSIVDFIDQELYEEKAVVFTNYADTFEKYGQVLRTYFGEEKIALFNKNMNEEELELSIYRFQNDDDCKILLCDETGGEGRNLQGANYVIHIDLPWDANAIEQRIGRLDRLGRAADALVILPADRETQGILEAFLAYVTLGNGSWNFDNSAMMVYRVQIWIEKWKKIIIDAVNSFEKQQIDYQDCALATEMIREIMQGVFTGTKVEGIPITNLMAKNLKNNSQNAHCPEWNSLVSMLLNNDEKVKDVITQYYNIIQGNLKSSQVFIRATEFNTDVRKIQKAKLLIPGEQLMLNDPIPQRREIREIYEKIYTRIPKVAEAEINKANKLLEQISMFIDYEDIDDEDIEDLVDKIKDFYETASNSLVNVHGNLSVLDGIKKDAKTIAVAFGEVEKGIDCKDALDTLLMFSKDPLSKLERLLLTLQVVQKDVEYVTRDVAKRKDNIFVDNGGDLSARYEESRSKIEEDCKLVADWKVM